MQLALERALRAGQRGMSQKFTPPPDEMRWEGLLLSLWPQKAGEFGCSFGRRKGPMVALAEAIARSGESIVCAPCSFLNTIDVHLHRVTCPKTPIEPL